MKYPPITAELLKTKNAWPSQLDLFKTHFGDKPVPLTKEVFIEFASIFSIDWAAEHLLDSMDFIEYKKLNEPATLDYWKVLGPALAACDKVVTPAGAHVAAAAWTAFAEYEKAKALNFLTLYTA